MNARRRGAFPKALRLVAGVARGRTNGYRVKAACDRSPTGRSLRWAHSSPAAELQFSCALGWGMPKDAPAKVVNDPVALRLAALGALMDHVIDRLKRSGERIRDLRVGIALTRGAATPAEPTTDVRRRDLDDLRE